MWLHSVQWQYKVTGVVECISIPSFHLDDVLVFNPLSYVNVINNIVKEGDHLSQKFEFKNVYVTVLGRIIIWIDLLRVK